MNFSEMDPALAAGCKGIFWIVLMVCAVLLLLMLVRCIRGPRVSDRLVAINMMGTIVIVMIAVMAFLLGEEYLLDICLIYAMISFLAVVMLAKVYIGIYEERRRQDD